MLTFFGGGPNQVSPGTYRLVLTVDGVELTQSVRVDPDPTQPTSVLTTGGDDGDEVDP